MHNNQDRHSVEAGTHKVLSLGIPSYNAAADIDRCVESILKGSDYAADIEIIIVDDGSKDETPQKADEWEARYPGIIRAVHQENGGHGMAVRPAQRHGHLLQGGRLGRLAGCLRALYHALHLARL